MVILSKHHGPKHLLNILLVPQSGDLSQWHCPYACLNIPFVCRQHCILVGHQKSSLVAVSALLTPRHCSSRWLVGLPLATAPFRWLQRKHGIVCHQRLGPVSHFWQSRLFRQSYGWLCAVHSDGQQTSALSCATALDLDFVVPPQLCDGSTIILTFSVVVSSNSQTG